MKRNVLYVGDVLDPPRGEVILGAILMHYVDGEIRILGEGVRQKHDGHTEMGGGEPGIPVLPVA